jgi:predicted alpha/beta-fold hydrolase
MAAKSCGEFEELLCVPMFEYKSLKEYHKDASCEFNLSKVKTPSLFINSLDDPISVPSLIPF